MISLRQGTQRVWWCGFLIFGSAYLATSLTVIPIFVDRFLVGFDEIYGVFGVLAATLAMLPVSGVLGGVLFVACHRRIQHSRAASH